MATWESFSPLPSPLESPHSSPPRTDTWISKIIAVYSKYPGPGHVVVCVGRPPRLPAAVPRHQQPGRHPHPRHHQHHRHHLTAGPITGGHWGHVTRCGALIGASCSPWRGAGCPSSLASSPGRAWPAWACSRAWNEGYPKVQVG